MRWNLRLCSTARRVAPVVLCGEADLIDAEVTVMGFDGGFSIASIGGHRARVRPVSA
jgi:hypothetical protein